MLAHALVSVPRVRNSIRRRLGALGVIVGSPISPRGLGAHSASQSGVALVLFEGSGFGTPWPQIYFALKDKGFDTKLLSVGTKRLVLVNDSPSLRENLARMPSETRRERNLRVHIPGVGFGLAPNVKSVSLRLLIGPITSLLVTGLAAIWFSSLAQFEEPATVIAQKTEEPVSCAIDFARPGMEQWLLGELSAMENILREQSVLIGTSNGSVSAEIVDQVGGAILLRVEIVCGDGRQQEMTFRTDASLSGGLVELPSD